MKSDCLAALLSSLTAPEAAFVIWNTAIPPLLLWALEEKLSRSIGRLNVARLGLALGGYAVGIAGGRLIAADSTDGLTIGVVAAGVFQASALLHWSARQHRLLQEGHD